ncbi:MAG: NOP58 family protein [Methanosarcinaceae archaeon]|nr:NOP58 family protein [Methanosarcinaceae archaeon]
MNFVTWFGVLAVDEKGTVSECDLFQKDRDELAKQLVNTEVVNANKPPLGFDLRAAAVECGFVGSNEEYDELLRDVGIRAAKEQISRSGTTDMRIIQSVEALDDIDGVVNALSERLAEWYGIYFPELDLTTEPLARFVSKYGSRSNISPDDSLYEKAATSMGAEISDADEELIKAFAVNVCNLYETRNSIEAYLIQIVTSNSPNLAAIAGALLGARLISLAGSLERLAYFPSSTVQVIGANKALFKHLRARAPSPKHGIIFNHPLIKNAPWWQRGKIARAVAAKISFASRIDLYSGKLDESLEVELARKLEVIRAANPKPPKKVKKSGGAKSGSKKVRRHG